MKIDNIKSHLKTLFLTFDRAGVGAVFIVFVSHVAFTVSYLMPPNPIKNKISETVQSYMGSLFYQNWHLFSPNPGIRYSRLEVACDARKKEEIDLIWEDIESQKQSVHEVTRVLGVSKSLQYYRHIGDSLWNKFVTEYQKCKSVYSESNKCLQLSKTKVQSSTHFKLIDRYAADFCLKKDSSPNFQVRLTRSNPIPFSKRANFEQLPHAETLSFKTHFLSEVQNNEHNN
jgi:hypothetical protein